MVCTYFSLPGQPCGSGRVVSLCLFCLSVCLSASLCLSRLVLCRSYIGVSTEMGDILRRCRPLFLPFHPSLRQNIASPDRQDNAHLPRGSETRDPSIADAARLASERTGNPFQPWPRGGKCVCICGVFSSFLFSFLFCPPSLVPETRSPVSTWSSPQHTTV